MWLTFDGEREKLRFPVLPAKINIKKGAKNESLQIAELGEITIIQSRQEVQLSFSSFFPSVPFHGIDPSLIKPPLTFKDKITVWQASKKPAHFILTGQNIDVYCTIEDFNYYEEGGDIGTLHFTLSLKEYRETQPRKVNVDIETQKATVSKDPARIDNTQTPQTYTVKPGDCLWNISKAYLGSGAKYTEIAALNKDIIKSPNLIYPGQILKLPPKTA
jgi:hypothetical protein